jgi:hypothetical protein
MERIPGIRVIGNASIEDKNRVKEEYEKKLFSHSETLSNQQKELQEKFEKIKTKEELEILDIIADEITNLRSQMELPDLKINHENFHILEEDFYNNYFDSVSSGKMSFREQAIVLNEKDVRTSLLTFAGTTLHESLHIHGHMTLEVNSYENGIEATEYRQGISVYPPQKKGYSGEFHTHFDGVHEAIVSEQEKKSLKKIIQLPLFDKDRENLFSEQAEKNKDIITKDNPDVSKEDILWMNDDGSKFQALSYPGPRKVLNYVCDNIAEKFPGKFSSGDEVFSLFLKAQFTGKLLDIARLTEETFGDGSFRRLGDMDANDGSAIKTLEALRKMKN